MTLYLALTVFGTFILDKESEVLAKHLTYPDTKHSAAELAAINNSEPSDMIRAVAEKLGEMDDDSVILDHTSYARSLEELIDKSVKVEEKSQVIQWFRNKQDTYLIESGIVSSTDDIQTFRHEVSLLVAKSTLSAASEEKDILLKNAIDAVEEIDKAINVSAMRLREWYSLHHPSLERIVENHEQFGKIITASGGKSEITETILRDAGLTDAQISSVLKELSGDLGAEFKKSDLAIVIVLSKSVLGLYTTRKELELYIEQMMKAIAPNITALAGHMVGARLISLAGSLMELARKPSSTVQVFGAEKALFRSIKTGAAPPKHGVIYQVPEIHSAPYWQRGKIARALAGKISIAAKIDAYSDRDMGKKLREDFERRVEDIKKQNAEEPPPKPYSPPKPPPRRHHRRSGDRGRRRERR
ncbi:MAG: C/D box methylation guide ribonucleoprotein complex aNOP56 subunit [Candidatus Thorarchaeota archaeon]